MAKKQQHQRAIELRKSGKSYSEIRNLLGVSKGTLSVWLKGYPLSASRLRALRDWNQKRIEHYRETRKVKREATLKTIYEQEKTNIRGFSGRDIFLSGLYLYWGEGGKTKMTEVSMSNTDPAVIKAFIFWIETSFRIPKSKLRIRLHLYRDMNVSAETKFWSRALKMDRKYFKKPYIKKSALQDLSYRNGFGHGTCNILLANAIVAKRVLMGLKVLKDFYMGL